MLKSTTEADWQHFLDAEKKHDRRASLSALNRFIDALLGEDQATWHSWAYDLAAKIWDAKVDIPIRYPLVTRVLLPALNEGALNGVQGCLRWLAVCGRGSQLDARLPEHLRTPVGLLKEAIRIDPNDRIARNRLLEIWAPTFEYSLHELPAGVLYGHNGATIAECGELLEFLDEFRTYAAELEQPSRYSSLIADCDLHFRCYRSYLQQDRPGGSYGEFYEHYRGTELAKKNELSDRQ
ncbi:MAG: hypothetical protein J0M17_22180 [Planctomycetes bacterium]|nr:hypothetical protein [Planctomycetota bacterium]